MSDVESDIEEPLTVKKEEISRTMKIFVCTLLTGLTTVAVAIPTVMLTQRTIIPDTVENEVITYNFPFTTRAGWGAREPRQTLPLATPVSYVVIHHSYTPAACYNRQQCMQAMKSMQNFHMDDHKWWDIGYNFGVGSDGGVYEGRGWNILGAHALHFNNVSIGICAIGDWTNEIPPAEQLKTVKALIAAGVELGYIKRDYKLVGHRQVRDTECPGQAFFELIRTWNHWVAFPASYKDLVDVPELSQDFKIEYRKKLNATTYYTK